MSKVTYYATPDNMLARSTSEGVDWVEVFIVGVKKYRDKAYYLVKTLDGSKLFTTSEDFLFNKTDAVEEASENE